MRVADALVITPPDFRAEPKKSAILPQPPDSRFPSPDSRFPSPESRLSKNGRETGSERRQHAGGEGLERDFGTRKVAD